MEKLKKLSSHVLIVLILIGIVGVCLLFSSRKSGMFIDEIYTYGLSNSYYNPFLLEVEGGELREKLIDRDTLTDYLTVGSNDRFAYGSVYYNQVNDVHPPLYYWLLHTVCSFFPGVFTKWTGLLLDLAIYIFALILLYKLCSELFESTDTAAAVTVLYGLSTIGLSTMLMIRMYVLLTALTVLLSYTVLKLLREKKLRYYPLMGLTVFLGLLTQYYFVFYAFFLCAAYVICALARKDYKDLLRFSLWAFAGVAALVLVFPACLDQLFADSIVSGGSAVENLHNTGAYLQRFSAYWDSPINGIGVFVKGGLCVLCAGAAAVLLLVKRVIKASKEKEINFDALLFILPAVITYVIVVIISPVTSQRYVYNIMPVLFLLPGLFLHAVDKAVGRSSLMFFVKKAGVLLIAAFALWQARALPPMYLYPEHVEYDSLLAPYADCPCVYIDNNYASPISQDMLQLMSFDDFYVTADTGSRGMLDYIGDADNAVVYVDVSEFWASGFDADKVISELELSTGLENSRPLYSYELSRAYLLSR